MGPVVEVAKSGGTYKISSTIYIVGRFAAALPGTAARLAAAGHMERHDTSSTVFHLIVSANVDHESDHTQCRSLYIRSMPAQSFPEPAQWHI